ncbi:MAG: choice-of-anchor Q domain-containing protein [Bacteroidota bacterium]
MRNIPRCLLFVVVCLSTYSCKKDEILTDPSAKLDFSVDTVMFDTVFTTIGTTTQALVIYNNNSQPLLISSVRLAGGNASPYRLNLDGVPGKSFSEVEIPGKDSLFLFVEVTVDPNNALTPFIVQDSVVFSTNGNVQDVDLVAFGRNARFIVADRAIQTANGFLAYALLDTNLNTTIVWDNTLPYVILGGYAVVDSTQTLMVQPGTEIYFGNSSGIWVYRYGTIKVQGTLQDPVTFQGVRRESYYQDVPGQWDRIWINEGSSGNEINYAEINNPFIGVQAECLIDTFPAKGLKITNTKITNASGFSLFTRYYNVEVKNSVLARAGQYSVALTRGGGYRFVHTTIANYWSSGQRSTPSVYMNDYGLDQSGNALSFPLYQADFDNCIIWGNNEDELELDFEFGTTTHRFRNVLVRSKGQLTGPSFQSIIKNQDPLFEDYPDNDYQLRAGSPAVDFGNVNFLDPDTQLDILGNSRVSSPDLGAYEKQ